MMHFPQYDYVGHDCVRGNTQLHIDVGVRYGVARERLEEEKKFVIVYSHDKHKP